MKTTNFYETDSHQMNHCDDCPMPSAYIEAGEKGSYSVVKHAIIENRACWNNPEDLEYMRVIHEAKGTLAIFEAALQCIKCAGGMCLIVDGNTNWQVGGESAVGITQDQ